MLFTDNGVKYRVIIAADVIDGFCFLIRHRVSPNALFIGRSIQKQWFALLVLIIEGAGMRRCALGLCIRKVQLLAGVRGRINGIHGRIFRINGRIDGRILRLSFVIAQLRIGPNGTVAGNIIRAGTGDQLQFGGTFNLDRKGVSLSGHKVNDLVRQNTVHIDVEGGKASGQSRHVAVGLAYGRRKEGIIIAADIIDELGVKAGARVRRKTFFVGLTG